MSEEEFNMIMSRRIRYYLELHGMTQLELSKRLHVSTSTVNDWIKAKKTPRMDKVDAMCELFGCVRSDLMQDKTPQQYYEEETAAIAEQIANNKELRMLMDAARDTDPKTIEELHNYLLYLKNKELHTEG